LPRFLVGILVVVLFILVTFVIVEVIVVIVIQVVFIEGVMKHKEVVRHVVDCHDGGSAVGFAFSRPDVGYVDQKWRPHFGHTQN
jgi:hypothetical protein